MLGLFRRTVFIFGLMLGITTVLLWHYRQEGSLSGILIDTYDNSSNTTASYLVLPEEDTSPQIIGKPLPNGQLHSYSAVWSLTRAEIAFLHGWGQNVYKIPIQNSNYITNLSNLGTYRWGLNWSPDGQWLSHFTGNDGGHSFISRTRQDEQETQELVDWNFITTYGSLNPFIYPQWGHDSKIIYFAADMLPPHNSGILRVDIDTKIISIFIETLEGSIQDFAISYDGQKIAYFVGDKLFVINTKSNNEPEVLLEDLPDNVDGLSWSPDGQYITYHVWDAYTVGQTSNIYITTLTGEEQLIGDSTINEDSPVWSPDGQWIAFVAESAEGYDLYRMRSDGSNREQLTNLGILSPEYAPRWYMYPDYPISYSILAVITGLGLGLTTTLKFLIKR